MPAPDPLPPIEPSPEEVRRAAETILSRPEFQQPDPSILDRIQQALGDLLDRVVSSVFGPDRSAFVALVIAALVLALIGLLVFRLSATRGWRRRVVQPGVEIEPLLPASDWDERARTHAAAGEWREAIRCRHRALVARLAASGVVDEIPGRTAGEYRLDVRASCPDADDPFASATGVFERVWYGPDAGSADVDREITASADETIARVRS